MVFLHSCESSSNSRCCDAKCVNLHSSEDGTVLVPDSVIGTKLGAGSVLGAWCGHVRLSLTFCRGVAVLPLVYFALLLMHRSGLLGFGLPDSPLRRLALYAPCAGLVDCRNGLF